MRLWSLHPRLLDGIGLVACWREALLAQKVLRGHTTGYRNHPQLVRFREASDPVAAVCTYLAGVADEAQARSFRFDRTLIVRPADPSLQLPVTDGQLAYEWRWLQSKLEQRSPTLHGLGSPAPHPLFQVVAGPVADWEVERRPAAPTTDRSRPKEPGRDQRR